MFRRLITTSVIIGALLIPSCAVVFADGQRPLEMVEEDGSPSAKRVNKINVTNGTLTKVSESEVTLSTGGGGGSIDAGTVDNQSTRWDQANQTWEPTSMMLLDDVIERITVEGNVSVSESLTASSIFLEDGTAITGASSSLDVGTAEGQMVYWDQGEQAYKPTSTSALVWDNTSGLLGIGKASPAEELDIVGDATISVDTSVGQDLTVNRDVYVDGTSAFVGAVTAPTLDTGQGANELYSMNQPVETTNAVVFTTVNTGQGAYELYAMNQDVQTTSNVNFKNLTVSETFNVSGDAAGNVNLSINNDIAIIDGQELIVFSDSNPTELDKSNHIRITSNYFTNGFEVLGFEVARDATQTGNLTASAYIGTYGAAGFTADSTIETVTLAVNDFTKADDGTLTSSTVASGKYIAVDVGLNATGDYTWYVRGYRNDA